MKNTVRTITKAESEERKAWYKSENVFVAELDGSKVENRTDLFRQIETIFEFPDGIICVNWASFSDWMTDLGWLIYNKKFAGFSLFIYNFNDLLCDSCSDKRIFTKILRGTVLPYWEDDVVKCTCNGYGVPRLFNVFLVEE